MEKSDQSEKQAKKGRFSDAWLTDEQLKVWVDKVPSNDKQFRCKICKKNFSCYSLSQVKRHARSTQHRKRVEKNSSDDEDDEDDDDDDYDDDDHDYNDCNEPPSKKKTFRRKPFRQKWLEIEQFKPWLREIPDEPSGFFCAVCHKACTGGLYHIYRHAETEIHKVQSKRAGTKIHKSMCAREGGIPDDTEENDSLLQFDEQKKLMEIRYAALITEENIPTELAKKILNFFQNAGKTPNVLRSLSMGPTKCTNIVSNVLCPIETNRTVDIIKNTPFSIYVNEMSGGLSEKWQLFYVRYVNPNTLQVHSQLVKLIDVSVSSYTDKLFHAFNREMTNFQIPYANIVALSCDNVNDIYGKHLFFKKKLKELCNKILVMSCPCHSAALTAHAACARIPQRFEEFVKKIANYNNIIPKRTSVFREFCKCFEERRGILSLQLSDTPWLSHHACIEKLLDSWDIIKRFLNERRKDEKIIVEKNLLGVMQNSDTKAYLLFLKHGLSFYEKFIASFRVAETKIHLLHPQSINFLTNICTHFLKPDCINDLPNVEFSKSENHKDLEDIKLGPECEEYLERLLQEEEEEHKSLVMTVRSDCLQFYITTAEEICKRLPVNDEFLSKLEIFLPHIALLNRDRKTSFDDLMFIAQTLGNFYENGLMEEWFKLNDDFTLEEKENLMKLNFDDMWIEILRSECSLSHEVKYPHLKSLLNMIRSLPNSNMDPEYIFTILSDIKKIKRNNMWSSAVNAICVLKSALKTRKETVLNMTLDAKHTSLMSSDKYVNFTRSKKNQQNAANNDNPSSSNTQ